MSGAGVSPGAGKQGLEAAESGVALLRAFPESLLWYGAGAVPFILGLLYFIADMSRSPWAGARLVPEALFLTLFFFWMKIAQSRFMTLLFARMGAMPAPPVFRFRDVLFYLHAAGIQAAGFFLLPLAVLITIPLPFAVSFMTLSLLPPEGQPVTLRSILSAAFIRSRPRQGELAVVLFVFSLLYVLVWINLAILIFFLPHMGRIFLGTETTASMSAWSMFNTTFFSAVTLLACLIVDPMIKAAIAWRGFHIDAVRTGRDLLVRLGKVRARTTVIAVVGLLCLLPGAGGAKTGHAADSGAAARPEFCSSSHACRAAHMNEAIDTVIRRPEFAWRFPRPDDHKDREPPAFLMSMRKFIRDLIQSVLVPAGEMFEPILDKMEKLMARLFSRKSSRAGDEQGRDWQSRMSAWLYAGLGGFCLFVLFLVFRYRRLRSPDAPDPDSASKAVARPNPRDESLSAALLPADEWMALAAELRKKGALRLCLRAVYLAVLAGLGDAGHIRIALYKSNGEYRAELLRKTRDFPRAGEAFGEMIRRFEQVYYGRHPATERDVDEFDRLRRDILFPEEMPVIGRDPAAFSGGGHAPAH